VACLRFGRARKCPIYVLHLRTHGIDLHTKD
jgi:hypothetical protein